MKDNVNPGELLELAVEILDEKGWCQGQASDSDGKVCLLEAMQQADQRLRSNQLFTSDGFFEAKDYLKSISPDLGEIGRANLVPDSNSCIGEMSAWNDFISRTADEVREKLIEGAKHFRNEGR